MWGCAWVGAPRPPLRAQSLETAFYIKEAFLGETGLAGTLRKLPVEKKFRLEVIKAVRVKQRRCWFRKSTAS